MPITPMYTKKTTMNAPLETGWVRPSGYPVYTDEMLLEETSTIYLTVNKTSQTFIYAYLEPGQTIPSDKDKLKYDFYNVDSLGNKTYVSSAIAASNTAVVNPCTTSICSVRIRHLCGARIQCFYISDGTVRSSVLEIACCRTCYKEASSSSALLANLKSYTCINSTGWFVAGGSLKLLNVRISLLPSDYPNNTFSTHGLRISGSSTKYISDLKIAISGNGEYPMHSFYLGYINKISCFSFNKKNFIKPLAITINYLDIYNIDLSYFNVDNCSNFNFNYCLKLISFKKPNGISTSIKTFNNMFACDKKLTEVDLSFLQTQQAISFLGMFDYCYKLKKIDISHFETGLVTTMENMFRYCEALEELILPTFDCSNLTKTSGMFGNCIKLQSLDFSSHNFILTDKVTDISYMFDGCKLLKTITGLDNWDVSNVTTLSTLFNNCMVLLLIDLTTWNTANVISMYYTFCNCRKLDTSSVGVCDWNYTNVTTILKIFGQNETMTYFETDYSFSNLTNMSSAFTNCINILYVRMPNFNPPNLTKIDYCFYYCYKITLILLSNSFTALNVTSFNNIFTRCLVLTDLDLSGWNTSKGTKFDYMFAQCSKIFDGVENLDVSNATSLASMFAEINAPTYDLDLSSWNTSNNTSMQNFLSNAKLNSLIIPFNTKNVTTMNGLFNGFKLTTDQTLDLTTFNFSKLVNAGINVMFTSCNATHIIFPIEDETQESSAALSSSVTTTLIFGASDYLTTLTRFFKPQNNFTMTGTYYPKNLTRESIVEIFTVLPTVTTTKTCTLKSTLYSKVTADDIAVATAKGWTVLSA